MPHYGSGAVPLDISALLRTGSMGGLTDGQLLERFLSRQGDESEIAFRALMARHGTLVLGVCRRVLNDTHDAEDAFQATFLILVRKAGSIRVEDSLGRWLHGVSYRVAMRAKAKALRRRMIKGVAARAIAPPGEIAEVRDLRAVIDEEVYRLPERYRASVVLCDLGGLSYEDAARQLGCPIGTVKSRLARGRERLRCRLTRRGLAPSIDAEGMGLFPVAGPTAVPTTLQDPTVRSAIRLATGMTTKGVISASVAELIRKVTFAMFFLRLKTPLLVLILLGAVGAGATALSGQGPAAKPSARPARGEEQRPVVNDGPSGRPSSSGLAKARVESRLRLLDWVTRAYLGGDVAIDPVLSASRDLMEAERDASETKSGRAASLRAYLERTKRLLDQLDPNTVKQLDIERLKASQLDAQYWLAKEGGSESPPSKVR
jgi:RNA polymerase sigma factor (sigma-70 family)